MQTKETNDLTGQEVRKTWQEASRRYFNPTPEEYESLYRDNKKTALENLAARYRWFSTFGLVMLLCSFSWLGLRLPISSEGMRMVLTVVMMLYFATCSAIDWWLYRGIRSIDCFTMSVKEVVGKALYYRRKHLQSMMFLLPFAAGILGLLAYSMKSDKYIIIGMVAGALIGLLIGYRQFTLFMNEYNVISE